MINCSHMLHNKDVECVTIKTSNEYTCMLSQCVYSFEVLVVTCSHKKGTPLMGLFVGKLKFHFEMNFIVFEFN